MTPGNVPIRLGLMAPFTGLVELYGPEISWAGQIAADEINEQGGLLGRPLDLVVVDDGSLPDTAVPAANRLIDEEGCVAIIGNLLSNSRISVANMVADPKKVPHLNFSFYEGSIWSRYFFHFAALPNQQIEKMIPYMADRFGPKIFFAGSNYEWPRGSIDAAKRSLLARGGEVVGEKYFPFGTDDFRELLNLLEASGADVFVPYFAGSDQTNLLAQFTNRGLKDRMAVVMGHYDEAMVGNLAPEIRAGFFSSNTYFMTVDTPENHSYLERLARHQGVTGVWPNGNGVLTNFGEGTYVCVKAFAAAVEAAGSTDPEELVNALETISVHGPQGLVEMDPSTHHAKVNTHLSQCNADGTFSLVESFGSLPPVIPALYRDLFPGLKELGKEPDYQNDAKEWDHDVEVGPEAKSAVIKASAEGRILDVNAGMAEIFGYSKDEVFNLSIHILLPPHMRDQHKVFFQKFMTSEKMSIIMGEQGRVFGYRKDGSQFPARVGVTKVKRGDATEAVATLFDITDHVESKERVKLQATYDPLTGLMNRSLIEERLMGVIKRAEGNNQNFRMVLLDINGFGDLNREKGFEEGDRVLVSVAEAIKAEAEPGDIIGRLGGDEFLVISENVNPSNEADLLKGRIEGRLRGEGGGPGVDFTAKEFIGSGSEGSGVEMLLELEA